jgi:hypothetical protein
MQIAHTLYMDFNNLVSVQIKFKIFISKYLYIHSFSMPMGAKLIYKNVAWKIMDAIQMVQNVY